MNKIKWHSNSTAQDTRPSLETYWSIRVTRINNNWHHVTTGNNAGSLHFGRQCTRTESPDNWGVKTVIGSDADISGYKLTTIKMLLFDPLGWHLDWLSAWKIIFCPFYDYILKSGKIGFYPQFYPSILLKPNYNFEYIYNIRQFNVKQDL